MSMLFAPPLRFVTPRLSLIAGAISLALASAGHTAVEADNPSQILSTQPIDDGLHTAINLDQLARQAVSVDAESAAAAIQQLRAAGPAGLQALLQTHRQDLQRLWIPTPMPTSAPAHEEPFDGGTSSPTATIPARPSHTMNVLLAGVQQAWLEAQSGQPKLTRLRHATEQVAAQRDAHASGLFWHTDLAAAKRAAAELQRPILSLRLLGRLDEEMSCANSRLFRTTLYCDPAISRRLRDGFVLHWESVRPVPRMIIDYGDGRRLEQTITGNSVHYLLSPDGKPLDALPGLYSPGEFTAWLDQGDALAVWIENWDADRRAPYLRAYHQQQLKQADPAGNPDMVWRSWLGANGHPAEPEATAAMAARLTLSKNAIEVRPLRQAGILAPPADSLASVLERDSERRHAELTLSPAARALIRAKLGADQDPERFASMIDNLERSIAGDTALNELVLRPRLRQWFVDDRIPTDLGELTELLYAELFLTPLDDPWMGMANIAFWPAIDHGGMTVPSGAP